MSTGSFKTKKQQRTHATLAVTFASLGVFAAALSGLSACSTVEGAGEDLEYLGDSISDESEDVQND